VAEVFGRPEHGFAVIPNAELRAFWASVQAGRLPGVAAICASAPPPSLLAGVVHADAVRGDVEIRCPADACNLTVELFEADPSKPGEEREVGRYAMPLAPGKTPSEWAQAILQGRFAAAPAPEGGLGMIGMLGALKPGVTVAVHDAQQTGPWARPIDGAMFEPHVRALDACRKSAPPWRDWWGQQTVIEVDAAGKVTRCEGDLPDHLGSPEHRCGCDLIRTMDLGASSGPRRASFFLTLTEVLPPRKANMFGQASFEVTHASDRSAVLGTRAVDDAALPRCVDRASAPIREVELPAELDVGPDGRVTRHALGGSPGVPAVVRDCIDEVLSRAQFNCPLSGKAHIAAKVQVSATPLREMRSRPGG
jgi:hypothetical protein